MPPMYESKRPYFQLKQGKAAKLFRFLGKWSEIVLNYEKRDDTHPGQKIKNLCVYRFASP